MDLSSTFANHLQDHRQSLRQLVRIALFVATTAVCMFSQGIALAQTPVLKGLIWLGYRQNLNGSWGAFAELSPRDTARALVAYRLNAVENERPRAALGWLASQSNLSSNQFLAEQALALHLYGLDNTTQLSRLASQGSWMGPDFGGFSGYGGTTWDSALALEAFSTREAAYTASVAGLVTTLLEQQNPDGGWGLGRSFASHPLLTAEVLLALSNLETVHPPVSAISAAQNYLLSLRAANGSIGGGPLETAVYFRALALSGYDVSSLSPRPIAFLQSVQLADGSWNGDQFVTARVLEAFAIDRPNFVIPSGGVVLTPGSVEEGGSVTAQVTVRNIGTLTGGATTVRLYAGDITGQFLGSATVASLASGASANASIAFRGQGPGPETIVAMADADRVVSESLETDNTRSALLSITAKPDLSIYGASIATVPARLAPEKEGTVTAAVSNNGGSEATQVGYRIFGGQNGTVLTAEGVIDSIAARESRVLSASVTLGAGTHLLRIVIDWENRIPEIREDDNSATRLITVGAQTDTDLVIESITAAPSRPSSGDIVTIQVRVANRGGDPVSASVGIYDGLPFSGLLIATLPVQLEGGASATVTTTATASSSTRVISALADPANEVAETFETNNEAQFGLTDAFVDLAIERDGIVLPRTALSAGQTVNGRVVVRNRGTALAENATVSVYDDLVAAGGIRLVQTSVTVPAGGRVVVPVQFVARAGQRYATALVNAERSILESSHDDNGSHRAYVVSGTGTDLRINVTSQITRAQAVDTSALVVDNATLRVSGTLRLNLAGNAASQFSVQLFEDTDGDGAYHPDADSVLGSAIGRAGTDPQYVQIEAAGNVRFAPGRIFLHLDNSNVIAESNESNNLVELFQDCTTSTKTFVPFVKWTAGEQMRGLAATGRYIDTNGDGVRDENDQPVVVYATSEDVIVRQGSTGEVLWRRSLGEGAQGSYMMPAVGDVDRDGTVEVIVHVPTHRLTALSMETGATKWTSAELYRVADWERTGGRYRYAGGPAIADLEGDGSIEVISGRTVLNGATGAVKWVGTGGQGRAWNLAGGDYEYISGFPDQELPIAADLDGDGKLEVIAGNTAYRADGTIVWQRSDLADGYTAAVSVAVDPRPRICLVAAGNVFLLSFDGSTIWGPVAIPGGATLGGAPTVFMDGANGPYIGVAGDSNYSALRASDGTVAWTQRVSETLLPTLSSATAFDFGTGIALAYQSSTQFAILNGRSGALLYSDSRSAFPYYPGQPVVADLDGDGHAELIQPGYNDVNTTLRVIGDVTWNGALSVYNQASFHVANVSETGEIPVPETQSAFSRGHYRAISATTAATTSLPNLTASRFRVNTAPYPQKIQLVVRVGNSGAATAGAGLPVAIYNKTATGRTVVTVLRASAPLLAGEFADLGYDWPSPGAGALELYAVANDDGTGTPTSANPEPIHTAVLECNTADNRTANFPVALTTDIVAIPSSLSMSDSFPRPGENVRLSGRAEVFGGIDTATLRAQFFLGAPASGGLAISPPLPVTIETYAGSRIALVTYNWTAAGAPGPAELFLVFDPAAAQPEDVETNNVISALITISTSDAVKEVGGTFVLGPPSAEPGQAVLVAALIRNIGNIALDGFTARYEARNGAGVVVATGSASVAALPKGEQAWITFEPFTPSTSGEFSLRFTTTVPDLRISVPNATLHVAPFVGVELTAAPTRVPTSNPVVQIRASVRQLNEAVLTEDPLRSSVIATLNRATAFQASTTYYVMSTRPCYQCHIQPLAIVSLESARQVAGVNVPPDTIGGIVTSLLTARHANGTFPPDQTHGIRGLTIIAAWSLAAVTGDAGPSHLEPTLDWLVSQQAADGSFNCDLCDSAPYSNPESMTMMAARAFARGYTLTGKTQYAQVLSRAVSWMLAQNYLAGINTQPERAARLAMGLTNALEGVGDPVMEASIRRRLQEIAAALSAQQNPDGTFGGATSPRLPVIRTAQCLEALLGAGYAPDEPHARAAILWLISKQDGNGGWWEREVDPYPILQLDESGWAMLALASSAHSIGQLDAKLEIELPAETKLEWSSSPGLVTATSPTSTTYSWAVPEISAIGTELLANVELSRLADGETRPVALAAAIAYSNPYTRERVERPLSIPSVTGSSPIAVSVATNQAGYQAGDVVHVTETITNLGADTSSVTNSLSVVDANGTAVATVVTGETIADLPRLAAPGWHFKVPVTIPVDTSREGAVAIDFGQLLAQLGTTGPIEPGSIRVITRTELREEWPFSYYPNPTSYDRGRLIIAIPSTRPVGSSVDLDVYFDTSANGPKPVSTFANAFGDGLGLTATYWSFTWPYGTGVEILDPSWLTKSSPPLAVRNQRTTTMGTVPSAVTAVSWRWMTEWVGELYVPESGTYGFTLTSNDGSWLYVDGNLVIDNHYFNNTTRTGQVALTAGVHRFEVVMFKQACCTYGLSFGWQPPGSSVASAIPLENLRVSVTPTPGVSVGQATLAEVSVTRNYTWPTGSTAAGSYSMTAMLDRSGVELARAQAPFTIGSSASVSATIATDRAAYDPGSLVSLTGSVSASSGNATLTNLTARLRIVGPDGLTVFQSETPIPTLLAGQVAPVTAQWPVASSPAGTYTARLSVLSDGQIVLAEAAAPFQVRASSSTGAGLTGSIAAAPATVTRGAAVLLNVSVTNGGNESLSNAPFAVRVVDAGGATLVAELPLTLSVASGATATSQLSLATAAFTEGSYTAFLSALVGGTPRALGSAPFSVTPPADASLSGSLSTSASVTLGDPVTFAVSLTNGGSAALNNGAFEVRIADPASGTLLTTVSFSATVNAGATFTSELTTGTTSIGAGSRVARLVSLTSGRTLAEMSFEIVYRPDHFLTATVSAPGSVTTGAPVGISVSITNAGTTSAAGSFALRITSGTGTVVGTLPLTATISAGATYTTTLSFDTGELPPGNYAVTLVSLMATPEKPLATTSFALVEPADAHVTGTVTAPASVYFSDDATLHVGLTNGGTAALTNGAFEVRITDATTGASLAVRPFTATVAAGGSYTTDLTQPTTPLGTGTRTATLVSLTSQKTLATTTLEVVYRPDHFLTATVTTAPSTTTGDPLTFHVTLTNGGTTAVEGGTFALRITDAAGVLITTLNVTATLAAGGSFSTDLTLETATLPAGTYTASFASLLTTAEKTLATTSFTLVEPADAHITGSLSSAASVYFGDYATFHVTLGNSGTSSIENGTFEIRVVDTTSGTTLATIPFVASVAAGGSFAEDFAQATAAIGVGTRTSRLVSLTSQKTLATATFEVAYRPDHFLTASISATTPVTIGQPLSLAISIANRGTTSLTGTFEVRLTDAANVTVATIPFSGAITAGGTYATTLTEDTATLVAGSYTAKVMSTMASPASLLASAGFELVEPSTAYVTGTVSVPSTASVGDTLNVEVTLRNDGASPVTAGAFILTIRSSAGAPIAEVPFTSTLGSGQTSATELPVPTSGFAPGDYTATLSILGTEPRMLDTQSFTLVEGSVLVDVRLAPLPRVLLWADCRSGNNTKPCTPVAPARITATLSTAGIPFTLVGTETDFQRGVRTGAYSEAILYQLGADEVKGSLEYLSAIRSGLGLVYVGNRTNANPKLDPALGVAFRGKLQGPVTVQLLETPFTEAGTLQLQGDGVAIDLAAAHPAALVMATQAPAIGFMTYGNGRVVVIPFDTELTPAADRLVLDAIRYAAKIPASTLVANQVVPIAIRVENASPSPVNITVSATMTSGASVVDASPTPQSMTPVTWSFELAADATRTLGLWLRMPDQIGTVRLTVTVTGAGAPQTTTLDFIVTEDATTLARALRTTLEQMLDVASPQDAVALRNALNTVVWISGLTAPDGTTIDSVLQQIMALETGLESVSADTAAARTQAGRLLAYWQTRSRS